MHTDLYSAAVTTVPLLLLALVAQTKLFGPLPEGRHRRSWRRGALLDVAVLLLLFGGFMGALSAITFDRDDRTLRYLAFYGLAIGAFGVFIHAAASVYRMYHPLQPTNDRV